MYPHLLTSIKLPTSLHYSPLEQISILASEFYFFSKVLAIVVDIDILTLAYGSGQNIILINEWMYLSYCIMINKYPMNTPIGLEMYKLRIN